MRQLSLLIITTSPFPNGLASTNRIISYCKGLHKNDVEAKVIVLFPTEKQNAIVNKEAKGVYQGIYFQYASKTTVKKSSKAAYFLQLIIALLHTIYIIHHEKKKSNIDSIIYYTKELSLTYFFFIITRIYKIIFIKEESESPEVYFTNAKFLKSLYARLYLHSYQLFDGYLIMTKHIRDYLLKLNISKNKLLHVPQTVEYERFQTTIENSSILERITYCGLLNQEKDGVFDLIQAFAIVAASHPNIELCLVGEASNNEDKTKIGALLEGLKIKEKTSITGMITRDEIPEYIGKSSLLIMPRPKSHQADYGFPTKLVEYLSSGKPVIATKVGEVTDYLVDNENSYLIEPDNINALISKINYVLEHKNEACLVGLKGKELVLKEFNYIKQTQGIIEFIQFLKKAS